MLPTITWGGQEFYDISGIVRSDASMGGTRPATDGLAIHHSVAQTEFPDKNANGSSLDEMIAHVKAIDAYHVQQGYGGFGYTSIGFRDGTVMTVGRSAGKRAHVAHENWHLAGHVMAGDFSTREVPIGCMLGAARVAAAVQKEYGASAVKGHNDWVAPANRPAWSTACPGAMGFAIIDDIIVARNAIMSKQEEALALAIRQKIAAAIMPNVAKGDITAVAAQIRWLTGGKLCG